ncbi:hypothetical protein HPP92_002257 [Vanilla planifolia]|uniref:GAT domain-containing protein n=1 Tax=Vanilla planifolia TaxID=51239 RepID=A0A835S879_VANPL|nr:hypothetical protein HPP92_002257 [Vanilla planifolia]
MMARVHVFMQPSISRVVNRFRSRKVIEIIHSQFNLLVESRTNRIVFKLFGKTPNDFPHVLRAQIFNWLLHSPTDMESYIRPGCVILTLYLCLGVSSWNELWCDLGSSPKRLLSLTADDFWGAGWIYARVQHHIAVIYNGQIVLNAIGRGFIEVEENDLSSGFFPFIVAEDDICDELRMLESSINVVSCDALLEEKVKAARSLCVSFLHEIGWLLRRCHLRNRTKLVSSSLEAFPLVRFRWILRFAIDRDWTSIVKKLLDILFEENIDSGMLCPTEIALSEDLLHYAVQSNSKSIVKLLLRYKPMKRSDRDIDNYLFRPDMLGPSGITPLHIASTTTCAESMLNLLTDDPGQDCTGLTPEDYAIAGGHESYILLMLKKINKSTEKKDVVVVNIPAKLPLMSDATYEFCKLCEQHLECRSSLARSILYRPMLLSMVGIAAVCVCVGLLLKGPPEVGFMRHPFSFFLEEIFLSRKTRTESSCYFFCLLDDLTTTLVQQCRECQHTIQRIIETAAEDEAVLFEALNVNDELQKTLSKYEGMKKPRAMHSEPQPALIPVAVEPEDSPRPAQKYVVDWTLNLKWIV